MPLLLCPNDNSPMQCVQRSGVEFDICPTCRGVWLDRGELEKMLATARQDMADDPRPQQAGFLQRSLPQPPERAPERAPERVQERRDWDDRNHDDKYRKKRRSSIFDIFDCQPQ
jgi:uncharacterized protein